MAILSAGYIIEEVVDFLQTYGQEQILSQLTRSSLFELSTNFPLGPPTLEDPSYQLAYNLISRGAPTLCPFLTSQQLLNHVFNTHFSQYFDGNKIKIAVPDEQLEQVHFASLQDAQSPWISRNFFGDQLPAAILTASPLAMAQIQKALLYLVLCGKLDTNAESWRILIIERDVPFGHLAMEALSQLLEAVMGLQDPEKTLPHIQYKIIQREEEEGAILCPQENITSLDACLPASFDLVFDVAVFDSEVTPLIDSNAELSYIQIRPVQEGRGKKIQHNFVYGEKVEYPTLGTLKADGGFEFALTPYKPSITYFLRNIFRSDLSPEDIAPLLSGILVGKEGVYWEPSAYKRNIIHVLGSLLQPNLSLCVSASWIDLLQQVLFYETHKLMDTFWAPEPGSFSAPGSFSSYLKERKPLALLITPTFLNQHILSQDFGDIPVSFAGIKQAHSASIWSPTFHELYPGLADRIRSCFPSVQVCAFSGLVTYDILQDIQRALGVAELVNFSERIALVERSYIKYKIVPVAYRQSHSLMKNPEKGVVMVKYPIIKRIVKNITYELPTSTKRPSASVITKHPDVDEIPKGIIYHPDFSESPAEKLSSLKKYLESEHLSLATFPPENATISGNYSLDDLEYLSPYGNSYDLLLSRSLEQYPGNLFPARFSLHYQSPHSLEKFYLETDLPCSPTLGGNSYILYNEADRDSADQFYTHFFSVSLEKKEASTANREFLVLKELMQGISYPENFLPQFLEATLNRISEEKVQIKYVFEESHTGKVELYAYLEDASTHVQNLVLQGEISLADLSVSLTEEGEKNQVKATKLLEHIVAILERFYPIQGYLDTTLQIRGKGILALLDQFPEQELGLTVSFGNDALSLLTDYLKTEGYYSIDQASLTLLYQNSYSFAQFLEGLAGFTASFNLSEEGLEMVKSLHARIRMRKDTIRALYRLQSIGLIDFLDTDEELEVCHVRLSAKSEEVFESKYLAYIHPYLRESEEEKWINWAKYSQEESALERYVYALTSFHYEYLGPKRRNALLHGPMGIKWGLEQGSLELARYLKYYFFGLYAHPDYLPVDIQRKGEELSVLKKYISYLIKVPPALDIGSSFSNMQHLVWSCEYVQQQQAEDSNLLKALANYVRLAYICARTMPVLDTDPEKLLSYQEGLISSLLELKNETDETLWMETIYGMQDTAKAICPEFGRVFTEMLDVFLVNFYGQWLKSFNQKFIDLTV